MAVIVAPGFGIAWGALLFCRSPAAMVLSVCMLLALGAAVIAAIKSLYDPPDVIGLSRNSVYIATSERLLRCEIERPLASLKAVKIEPRDRRTDPSPGSISITLRNSGCLTICSNRSPEEIKRVAEAVKQSWQTFLAAEDAAMREGLAAFFRFCQQNAAVDDRAIVQHLVAAGTDPVLAAKITLIAPIAFARCIYAEQAHFSTYCLLIDNRGKPMRRLQLKDDRVFRQASELFKQLSADRANEDILMQIARRSPEAITIQAHKREPRDAPKTSKISLQSPRIPHFKFHYEEPNTVLKF